METTLAKYYTKERILNEFNVFKCYSVATESLSKAVILLGSPAKYSTAWDYIRELISDMCPNLSLEFIDKFSNAIDRIASDRLHHGFQIKEPLPKGFDSYKDDFEKIKTYINRV